MVYCYLLSAHFITSRTFLLRQMDCDKSRAENVASKILVNENEKKSKFKNPLTAHRSIFSTSMARCGSKNPFEGMKIADDSMLDRLEKRSKCDKCLKSRKFFCYDCYIGVTELQQFIPNINLPCSIDVIKHPLEALAKSTATHAAVVAPRSVKIHTFPNFPAYETDGQVALVFPSDNATDIELYIKEKSPDLKKLVFIDSTWLQAKQVFADARLQALPCVILPAKQSLFWRYQRGKPDTHLATIEAIYYAVVSLHRCQHASYDGQYDNLLFFFKYFYTKMNDMYFS